MMSSRSRLGVLFLGTISLFLYPARGRAQQETGQVAAPYLRPSGPVVVTYDGGELTIQVFNAPLASVLRAVANHLGILVEIPPGANESVVGVFGPGSPRNVLAALLNGSKFNYVMTGSLSDGRLQQLLLTARTDAHAKAPPEDKKQVGRPDSQTITAVPAGEIEKPAPITSRDQLRAEVDALIAEASANAAAEGAAVGETVGGHSSGVEQLRQVMEAALKNANTLVAPDPSVQDGQPIPAEQTTSIPRNRHRRR